MADVHDKITSHSFFLQPHKPNAEKKMKECFRQRFIKTMNQNPIFEN